MHIYRLLKYFSLIVVFDPSSFYGHHEYELAIAQMFGGFSRAFFSEYHSLVPKLPVTADAWNCTSYSII